MPQLITWHENDTNTEYVIISNDFVQFTIPKTIDGFNYALSMSIIMSQIAQDIDQQILPFPQAQPIVEEYFMI